MMISDKSNQSVFPNPNLDSSYITPDRDYLKMILTANVYDVAIETPLQEAIHLSARLQNKILLKREDLQPVFSFKLRGAYNRMNQLSDSEKQAGVIACSAGNHAQGVALAAKKMNLQAQIVMPLNTPPIKWKNVERLGAKVVLFGDDFEEARKECIRLSKLYSLPFIHPFDDPFVIAGQGTIGVEILHQTNPKDLDAIFICVGGGGLCSGIASYVKRLYPHIKIIGVETFDACAMTQSLLNGYKTDLDTVGLFADGAAVRSVGDETFRICKNLVDEMVLVSTDEICAAIKDVFEDTRSIIEPAGALGVAGCKKYISERNLSGMKFVAIASGANMNFDRLRFVADRAELGEKREILLSVVIPEHVGSFVKLYQSLYPSVVSEFAYRYSDDENAHIYLSLYLDPSKTISGLLQELESKGMKAKDVSLNEMVKSHGRYLIGGKKNIPNERLFQFSFPETKGALGRFLDILPTAINVSLFHYRNDGGDVGKVFVGLQIPLDKTNEFERFLSQLHYPVTEETDNPMANVILQGF